MPLGTPDDDLDQVNAGPQITLPEELRSKFENKLRQYEARLLARKNLEPQLTPDIEYRAPEVGMVGIIPHELISVTYKIALMRELLEKGVVNTQAFSLRMQAEHRGFDIGMFRNACGVIDLYTKGRLEN